MRQKYRLYEHMSIPRDKPQRSMLQFQQIKHAPTPEGNQAASLTQVYRLRGECCLCCFATTESV